MLTPKVLVVNDNPATLLALESILTMPAEKAGYVVISAQSGEDALRKILKHEFAVILLDINMPNMNGFETAEAIRAHPRWASIPIIFITAHYADDVSRLKGYQSGAVDYLYTPVVPEVLITKVGIFVELAKQKMELQAKTDELAKLNRDLRVQRLLDLERVNSELQAEIVERKHAEQRAHEMAIKDSLTGLLNRRSLIEHLEHAVAYSARHKTRFAVLFLDLDKFKSINDSFGHATGDQLLIHVAGRLRKAVREADVVARLGGDEFIVLLKGLSTSAEAAAVAEKISLSLASPYALGNRVVNTSASIGMALYPQDGAFAQALLQNADKAMYHAKEKRRGSIQFFQENMHA
jgi:diguanylate cyclase (GGDEF)-like protein